MAFTSTKWKFYQKSWDNNQQQQQENTPSWVDWNNPAINLVMSVNDFNTVISQLINIANFMKGKADEYVAMIKEIDWQEDNQDNDE